MDIPTVVLNHGKGLKIPEHATTGSAGIDLYAAINEKITILPLKRNFIPTGISIAIPQGYEGQIRSRSGLALKYGVMVLNSPGTIDSDYRGEISIILVNLGDIPFIVERGDRIAQMVVTEHQNVRLVPVHEHDQTQRGGNGFGSTGIK